MIEDAEEKGLIKPGYTLIEPTSGNTGIGLGMMAAVKGYKAIITTMDKCSMEKKTLLKALGTEMIPCRTNAFLHEPDSYENVAYKKHKEIKNSYVLNQVIIS
jgi:cystathionine beta-synthase